MTKTAPADLPARSFSFRHALFEHGTARQAALFGTVVVLSLFASILYRLELCTLPGAYFFSFALLGFLWPARLIEVYLFFVALGSRDFTYLAISFIGKPNGSGAIFITEWVLAILLLAALPKLRNTLRSYRFASGAIAAYLICGVLMFYLSLNGWRPADVVRDFAVVYYSLFAFAVLAHVSGEEGIKRLGIALLLGTVPNLLAEFLNYMYGTLPLTMKQKNISMRNSYYYIAAAGFILPYTLSELGRMRKLAVVYCAFVFMVVFFYSYSKTAMFAVLVLAALFLITNREKVKPAVLAFVGILFLLPLLATPANKTFHFSSLFSGTTYQYDSRRLLQQTAIRDFAENPFGIGFGPPIFGEHSKRTIANVEGFVALHNSYLTILRRTGVQGFFAFVFILVAAYNSVWKVRANVPVERKDEMMGVLFASVSCSIFSFAHVALEGPFFGVPFWIMVGCIFIYGRSDSRLGAYT